MSRYDKPIESLKFFRAMADPVRLRMVHLLTLRDELCVCDFTEVLQLPQSSVSRHLGILRNAGVLHSRREGVWIHYRLGLKTPSPHRMIVQQISMLAASEPLLARDAKRLIKKKF